MTRLTIVLLGLVLVSPAVGCGGGGSSPTEPGGSSSKTSALGACAVTASGPEGAVTAAGGPYYHDVAAGSTTDGLHVSGAADLLVHASVPDAVELPDGGVGVYYVNGEKGGIWFARLSGQTLTPVGAITIDGFVRPWGAVDPDALLVNGRIRLTYLMGFGSSDNTRAICQAESTDGLTFTSTNTAMNFGAGASETDPSLVQLPSGTWLLAVSRGTSTMLARSSSGTAFTEYSQVSYGGVPELALTSDNRVRLYVCSLGGINSYISSDSGSSWTSEGNVTGLDVPGRGGVCDPSALPSHNLFVFKTQ